MVSVALAQALTMAVMTMPASAQTTAASGTGNAAKGINEGEYSLVDIGDFVGWQWYQIYQGTSVPAVTRLNSGIAAGARVTENFWRYISLEQTFTFGSNRLEMLPSGNQWYAKVSETNYTIAALVDFNLTPRDAKFRPYVFVGPGYVIYRPGGIGSITAPSPGVSTPDLGSSVDLALLYGVGVKYNWQRRADFRFDVTGKISGEPHFQLPAVPPGANGLYSPPGGRENSLMASIGVDFRLGLHEPPPPVVAAPPPPPPPPPPPVQVGAITGAGTVCAGDSLALQVSASGGAPGATLAYQWLVDGQPAPGGTGTTFNLPTSGSPGTKTITVEVTAGGQSATSSPVTVTVQPVLPPTIQFSVTPSTVEFTAPPITLMANASAPNACNGNLTVTYSGDGVTGNSFNPGAVGGFDQTNRLKQQTRTVPLTATVRDARNQTASANANVTVTLKPAASRTDIVFPNRSSRVNNAAKRYLLEELTPRLRDDPNSTVILIGHRDTSETGRAAANLDTQRVLNAAAVLSAGKGVCASLDLSRVQVKFDGTDQTDPPQPFGDASVRERSGQGATDQRAQFRRVEVWFIPSGADAPAITGLQPAPVPAIRAKGCPR
jgi:outer membrane protein OmpA-like peptidoglycan-associated protein